MTKAISKHLINKDQFAIMIPWGAAADIPLRNSLPIPTKVEAVP